MKITIEHYGETHVIEFEHDDVPLQKVIQSFCYMLLAAGWSRDTIVQLFNEEGSFDNDPFDWSIS